jgi:plasmid stabilization system protein ParE
MRCGPNMAYLVSLAAPAETDVDAAFERIREAAPLHAEKWLKGLFEAIFSLQMSPTRCPIIPEANELAYPVRHLLFGEGRGIYRIIFDIREDEQHVRILRVWHSSRDAVTPADVEDSG